MAKSKMCESCVHTKVCMNNKNLFGDVFVLGHPLFFDNRELYKKYEEREKAGFQCDNYMRIVRCKDCKHKHGCACDYSAVWVRPNGFCHWGERREDDGDN